MLGVIDRLPRQINEQARDVPILMSKDQPTLWVEIGLLYPDDRLARLISAQARDR